MAHSKWLASSAQHAAAHEPTHLDPPRLRLPRLSSARRRSQRAQRPSRPDYCGPCLFCIILLTTKTLLSRKRPAQLATQLASLESSLLPGFVMHFSKQMSVSLEMAAWITAFWFSVSMKACSSLTCPSDGSCSMSAGSESDDTHATTAQKDG